MLDKVINIPFFYQRPIEHGEIIIHNKMVFGFHAKDNIPPLI